MGEPNLDIEISKFMSLTGTDDTKLARGLLEQNAMCMDLAIEEYENLYGKIGKQKPKPQSSDSMATVKVQKLGGEYTGKMHEIHSEASHHGFGTGHLFEPPAYRFKIPTSTKGWRLGFDEAVKQKKFVLMNVQDESIFGSHVLDRDVFGNSLVKDVVLADFVLMQVWKDGENYQDMCYAYPDLKRAELPCLMLCHAESHAELKRIEYRGLMKYAGLSMSGFGGEDDTFELCNGLVEILSNFVDRQKVQEEPSMEESISYSGMDENTENKKPEEPKKKPEEEEEKEPEEQKKKPEEKPKPSFEAPDDSKDTLEGHRKEASGEGIYKLRVKLPIGTGDLVNWDQFLPKTTPQRAFTTGVRHELKKRESAVPEGHVISVSIMDRSRKHVVVFSEDVATIKADPNTGATIGDVHGMRSGEVLFIEVGPPAAAAASS